MTQFVSRWRRVRGTDDGGQLMAALVILLAFTMLAFCAMILLPIGAATNDKTRSQTAADASALAAAEAIREHWVYVETQPIGLFHPAGGRARPLGIGLQARGVGPAQSYASANDATVIGYNASLGRGRVEVDVRNQYSSHAENGVAESSATAEMDANFTGCRWSPRPPINPLESTPPGPPTFTATLTCGAWSAGYIFSNSITAGFPAISYNAGTVPMGLYRDLEPRLVE